MIGGGERYAMELSRHLARETDTTLVSFFMGRGSPVLERFDRLNVRRYPTPWALRGDVTNPASLSFVKDLSQFDILHCYGHPKFVTDVCIASSLLGRPKVFVTDIGGGGVCLSSYLSRVGIDTRRFVDGFLLLSRYSERGFEPYRDRVSVIYGGVDTENWRPSEIERDGTVLFVGRLIPAKGVNYLLEAADATTPVRIVGRPYDKRYFRLLQDLAGGKAVVFRTDANDADLSREYSCALVTVVPSVLVDVYGSAVSAELLNLVSLESMACGTPVIATRCGALPEVVEDGVTGFIVAPNDPTALHEKIRFFRDHPEVAASMGRAGRERVMREFTWDRVAERCLDAYREVLGERLLAPRG